MTETEQVSAFETRVRIGLEKVEQDVRTAIQTGTPVPRLSVKSFVERTRISRSTLYEKHPILKALVESRLADLRSEIVSTSRTAKRRSVRSLTEELTRVRRDAVRQVEDAASISFADLMARSGPMFRDRQHLVLEVQRRDRIIDDLREKIARQNDLIQSMIEQLNVR